MKTQLRAVTVAALAILLIVAVGHSAVQGGLETKSQAGKTFKLYGSITGLDRDARSIQVSVDAPDHLAKLSPLTIQTNAETKFKFCDQGDNPVDIDFADLEEGCMVRITGKLSGDDHVATSVIKY